MQRWSIEWPWEGGLGIQGFFEQGRLEFKVREERMEGTDYPTYGEGQVVVSCQLGAIILVYKCGFTGSKVGSRLVSLALFILFLPFWLIVCCGLLALCDSFLLPLVRPCCL